jgi:uncharacterized protein (DUF427 family)
MNMSLVPGKLSDPNDHRVVVQPSPRRVRVFFGGEIIADSTRMRLLFETRHLPVYYFPLDDVNQQWLETTDHTSHCPYKGQARYWTARVGERIAENAVWNYPVPITDCPDIKDLVAFYWNKMDAWFEEDQQIFVHARDPYHRVDVVESSRHLEVRIDGVTVAESQRPMLLYETGLPTRYYLPRLDVRMDLFRDSDTRTACPYKGTARYWSGRLNGQDYADILWGYDTTIPEMPRIAGRVCFYDEKVDVYLDGELQRRPQTPWS